MTGRRDKRLNGMHRLRPLWLAAAAALMTGGCTRGPTDGYFAHVQAAQAYYGIPDSETRAQLALPPAANFIPASSVQIVAAADVNEVDLAADSVRIVQQDEVNELDLAADAATGGRRGSR